MKNILSRIGEALDRIILSIIDSYYRLKNLVPGIIGILFFVVMGLTIISGAISLGRALAFYAGSF